MVTTDSTFDPDLDVEELTEDETLDAVRDMRAVINGVLDAIIVHDPSGKVSAVNDPMLSLFGVDRGRARQIDLARDLSPSQAAGDELRAVFATALSGEPQLLERPMRRLDDGRLFHAELFVRALAMEDRTILMTTVRDLTSRRETEARLQMAAQVFDSTLEGIVVTDPGGVIQSVNAAFTEITGYTADEAVGQPSSLLKSDRHDREFYAQMWHGLLHDGAWEGEIWNRRRSGEAYAEWLSIAAIRDPAGVVSSYVAVFHDLSETKRHQEQIAFQAHHDALTGLPNRLLLRDRLERALAQARRASGHLAVLFLDLDVIAEGVETVEPATALRMLLCDRVQGYLLARPMEESSLRVLLREGLPPALLEAIGVGGLVGRRY